jgi:hypothetical protein
VVNSVHLGRGFIAGPCHRINKTITPHHGSSLLALLLRHLLVHSDIIHIFVSAACTVIIDPLHLLLPLSLCSDKVNRALKSHTFIAEALDHLETETISTCRLRPQPVQGFRAQDRPNVGQKPQVVWVFDLTRQTVSIVKTLLSTEFTLPGEFYPASPTLILCPFPSSQWWWYWSKYNRVDKGTEFRLPRAP